MTVPPADRPDPGPSSDSELGGDLIARKGAGKLREALLQPIETRSGLTGRAAQVAALERFDERAREEEALRTLAPEIRSALTKLRDHGWKNPAHVRAFTDLVTRLHASRRISTQRMVFLVANTLEALTEDRCLSGEYAAQLEPISSRMSEIALEQGLAADEAFARGSGTEEYWALSDRYDAILDEKFVEALREFGFDNLARMFLDDQQGFEICRERGRRALHHDDEPIEALRDIVLRHERDASRAASAGAFHAAITSLGAAVEGLLCFVVFSRPRSHLR